MARMHAMYSNREDFWHGAASFRDLRFEGYVLGLGVEGERCYASHMQ